MNSFSYLKIPPPGHGGARIDAGERRNSVEGKVLNPLSYIEIASRKAFILPAEKADLRRSLPWSFMGESVSTKHLIRRVKWKYIRPWRMSCIFISTLVGPTIITCIVIK